jgi:hypothetical protein
VDFNTLRQTDEAEPSALKGSSNTCVYRSGSLLWRARSGAAVQLVFITPGQRSEWKAPASSE